MKRIEIYVQDYSTWDDNWEDKEVVIYTESENTNIVGIARDQTKTTFVSIDDLKKAIESIEAVKK